MSRIYRTNPYYELPSTTVKIVYDDEVVEEEIVGEEFEIEELTLENLEQTYNKTKEEEKKEEQTVFDLRQNELDLKEAEITIKLVEADTKMMEAERILQDAKRDAEQLLVDTQREAEKLRDQIIREGIMLVDDKQQEGYNAGFNLHAAELNKALTNMNSLIEETVESLKAEEKAYIDSIEESLRGLAVEIAEKIMRKPLNDDPLALSCLTFELLDNLKKSKQVNIVLSNKAKELVEYVEKELKTNEQFNGRDISLETRDMPSDGLIIEHDAGTIDASISQQIAKIKEYFEI